MRTLEGNKSDVADPFNSPAWQPPGFGNRHMRYQGTLHFGGPEPVTAHVNHIVDAAHDPKISVTVAAGPVAGEVDSHRVATSTARDSVGG